MSTAFDIQRDGALTFIEEVRNDFDLGAPDSYEIVDLTAYTQAVSFMTGNFCKLPDCDEVYDLQDAGLEEFIADTTKAAKMQLILSKKSKTSSKRIPKAQPFDLYVCMLNAVMQKVDLANQIEGRMGRILWAAAWFQHLLTRQHVDHEEVEITDSMKEKLVAVDMIIHDILNHNTILVTPLGSMIYTKERDDIVQFNFVRSTSNGHWNCTDMIRFSPLPEVASYSIHNGYDDFVENRKAYPHELNTTTIDDRKMFPEMFMHFDTWHTFYHQYNNRLHMLPTKFTYNVQPAITGVSEYSIIASKAYETLSYYCPPYCTRMIMLSVAAYVMNMYEPLV